MVQRFRLVEWYLSSKEFLAILLRRVRIDFMEPETVIRIFGLGQLFRNQWYLSSKLM